MRIVFEGTEYEGAEGMPAEVRARYEAVLALARQAGVELPGGDGLRPDVHVKVNVRRRIVYDGVAYDDVEQLPGPVQQALARQGRLADAAGQRRVVRRRATPAELRAVGVLLGALLLGLVFYLQEYRALEYTFDDDRLFLWGAALGVLSGWLLLRLLLPRLPLGTAGRTIYGLFLIFALTMTGTALACRINRSLPRAPAETWSFTITAKRHVPASRRSSATWEVRADAHGRGLRFDVPPSLWARLQVGRTYTGEVRRGALGYAYLTDAGLH